MKKLVLCLAFPLFIVSSCAENQEKNTEVKESEEKPVVKEVIKDLEVIGEVNIDNYDGSSVKGIFTLVK